MGSPARSNPNRLSEVRPISSTLVNSRDDARRLTCCMHLPAMSMPETKGRTLKRVAFYAATWGTSSVNDDDYGLPCGNTVRPMMSTIACVNDEASRLPVRRYAQP